jgi:hypothetical protein
MEQKYLFINIIGYLFIIYIIFLTQELVFSTASAGITSVMRISPSPFEVHDEKFEKFRTLNSDHIKC